MPPGTVAALRSELTSDQNQQYRDYQLERWLKMEGSVAGALKAIAAQLENEERFRNIMSDPTRRQVTQQELNRQVLHLIHQPEQHKVIVFVDSSKQNPRFNERESADALLTFLTYLLPRIEELEGPNHQAILLIDQISAPPPSIQELQPNIRMFNQITQRSFPLIYEEKVVCCAWSSIVRRTLSAISGTFAVKFASPEDLCARFGPAYTPNSLGGQYPLEAAPPLGDVVMEYFRSREGQKGAPPPRASRSPGTRAWRQLTARRLRAGDKAGPPAQEAWAGARAWLAGALLLAMLAGEYLSALNVCAAAALTVVYRTKCGGQAEAPEGGSDTLLAYYLDGHLEKCRQLLGPATTHAPLESLKTRDGRAGAHFARAMCLTLPEESKTALRRAIEEGAEAIAATRAPGPQAQQAIRRFEALYLQLAWVSTLQVPCECGCGEAGSLDWLDEHLASEHSSPGSGVGRGATLKPPTSRHLLGELRRPSTPQPPSGSDGSESSECEGSCDVCGGRFGRRHRRSVCRNCNSHICSHCAVEPPSRLLCSGTITLCKRCVDQAYPPSLDSQPQSPLLSKMPWTTRRRSPRSPLSDMPPTGPSFSPITRRSAV